MIRPLAFVAVLVGDGAIVLASVTKDGPATVAAATFTLAALVILIVTDRRRR